VIRINGCDRHAAERTCAHRRARGQASATAHHRAAALDALPQLRPLTRRELADPDVLNDLLTRGADVLQAMKECTGKDMRSASTGS
jgi:hypothetical protein